MIFAHTLEQVLSGRKQQTRRLIKSGESLGKNTTIIKENGRILYEVGKTYAVQPNRGKKSVTRILMTGIRREQVGDISHADAVAEGFSSREDFLTTWRAIHGQDADLAREVWVFEFKLASGSIPHNINPRKANPE